jgi:periplasmic divalent cation tolerance protein
VTAEEFYMTDKRIVLTTAGSPEEARKIARELVERRLAACVNISSPVESVYRWKGDVETAQEYQLCIKTTEAAFPRLRQALVELHSYDVPECILISIEDGSPKYLEWIAESVES